MNKESSIEAGRCQCGDITYTLDKNKVCLLYTSPSPRD